VPKITKLCLHFLKLCRVSCGLFFSGHGVYSIDKAIFYRFVNFCLLILLFTYLIVFAMCIVVCELKWDIVYLYCEQ